MLLIGKVWELGCGFQRVARVSAVTVPEAVQIQMQRVKDAQGAACPSSAWTERAALLS